jgi:saccharopine dehydrogenase (NAD+, L-lysine-forming)
MRILVIGAGGVGTAAVAIAARRSFFEHMVVADYDPARVEHALAQVAGDARFSGARVDASSSPSIVELIREHGITHVLNAVDPRFVMPIFDACFEAGADYMDMAMSLSRPHPERPFELTGEKLGDRQFAKAGEWEAAGRLALVGLGVEPGLSDIFARYAQDELFSEIDEAGVRDGANLVVDGYDFAPGFSIWTTIEECLNPPVIYEAERGWFTTPPFSEPETFDFPDGIGPVECVNVEHEEVLLIPRWVKVKRATFKYGLGDEFINVLKVLHTLGLDRTERVDVKGVSVWRPAFPTRQDWATGCTARPVPACGSPARARMETRGRSTCTTWWTATGRGRSTGPRRSCGRRRSTPSWGWSSSSAARGRRPESWVRRPSNPSRSWISSWSTGHRGQCVRSRSRPEGPRRGGATLAPSDAVDPAR